MCTWLTCADITPNFSRWFVAQLPMFKLLKELLGFVLRPGNRDLLNEAGREIPHHTVNLPGPPTVRALLNNLRRKVQ